MLRLSSPRVSVAFCINICRLRAPRSMPAERSIVENWGRSPTAASSAAVRKAREWLWWAIVAIAQDLEPKSSKLYLALRLAFKGGWTGRGVPFGAAGVTPGKQTLFPTASNWQKLVVSLASVRVPDPEISNDEMRQSKLDSRPKIRAFPAF